MSSSAASQPIKLAILDDYAGLALSMGDWNKVKSAGVELTVFKDTLHDEEKLVERLRPFTIISTMRERTPFPSSLLSQLPNLKLLTTTGLRNLSISLPTTSSQSILVLGTNGTPQASEGRTGDATNEHCWSLILASTKNVVSDSSWIAQGAGREGKASSLGLRGKTLSILGFGRLGQALLPVARALGFKILVWSPNLTPERIAPFGSDITLASSLEHLLSSADVLTLQLVYSPSTRHIIGKKELSYIKPSAFLVNTSRGGLIDEDALVDALKEKKIRGAALDVFEQEPFVERNTFEGLDNVTLTPHMAYSTDETLDIWWKETVENIESWLEDGGASSKAKGRELKG
ncbi:D-isomer specific 2-hydroxyacid dehydrogenase [Mrakia frigida]|uniref:D-2-hydroxyacid dehydrogenase family protein n=1 Tax=Mrakia frigida TaxID=29902 RepID=UPI003FCBFD10